MGGLYVYAIKYTKGYSDSGYRDGRTGESYSVFGWREEKTLVTVGSDSAAEAVGKQLYKTQYVGVERLGPAD